MQEVNHTSLRSANAIAANVAQFSRDVVFFFFFKPPTVAAPCCRPSTAKLSCLFLCVHAHAGPPSLAPRVWVLWCERMRCFCCTCALDDRHSSTDGRTQAPATSELTENTRAQRCWWWCGCVCAMRAERESTDNRSRTTPPPARRHPDPGTFALALKRTLSALTHSLSLWAAVVGAVANCMVVVCYCCSYYYLVSRLWEPPRDHKESIDAVPFRRHHYHHQHHHHHLVV